MLATINKDAQALSTLGNIDREYSLYEIAIRTRAAPARSLGLKDRGHLGPGAHADITVYKEQKNKEKTFEKPEYVFKDGELVVRNGRITKVTWGATHVVRPEYDRSIENSIEAYFERYLTVQMENFKIRDEEITNNGCDKMIRHPCQPRITL